MRSREEIEKQLKIMVEMYEKAKELNYKPSIYWYLAKIEALAWVLGHSQLDIRIETSEREIFTLQEPPGSLRSKP